VHPGNVNDEWTGTVSPPAKEPAGTSV
jgi:hypothetical protein